MTEKILDSYDKIIPLLISNTALTENPMPASSATLDLDDIMDNAKLGRIQITVLVLSTLVTALEGFDLLAIAFAGPVISREWSMSPEALGILFGVGPVGLALGALLLSPLGDPIGRKPTILICMGIMGVSTLLSAFGTFRIQFGGHQTHATP